MKRSDALKLLNEFAEEIDLNAASMPIEKEALIYACIPPLLGWSSEEWESALNSVKMIRVTTALSAIKAVKAVNQ